MKSQNWPIYCRIHIYNSAREYNAVRYAVSSVLVLYNFMERQVLSVSYVPEPFEWRYSHIRPQLIRYGWRSYTMASTHWCSAGKMFNYNLKTEAVLWLAEIGGREVTCSLEMAKIIEETYCWLLRCNCILQENVWARGCSWLSGVCLIRADAKLEKIMEACESKYVLQSFWKWVKTA